MNLIEGHWLATRDGDKAASNLLKHHYSKIHYHDNRGMFDKRFCGPGKSLVYVTQDFQAVFVWKKWIDPSGQQGIYNAVFHNESAELSSTLILEAEQLAWSVWPGERLYTYVDPLKVASRNPGYCYLCAGWKRAGYTASGKLILEKLPQEAANG